MAPVLLLLLLRLTVTGGHGLPGAVALLSVREPEIPLIKECCHDHSAVSAEPSGVTHHRVSLES